MIFPRHAQTWTTQLLEIFLQTSVLFSFLGNWWSSWLIRALSRWIVTFADIDLASIGEFQSSWCSLDAFACCTVGISWCFPFPGAWDSLWSSDLASYICGTRSEVGHCHSGCFEQENSWEKKNTKRMLVHFNI